MDFHLKMVIITPMINYEIQYIICISGQGWLFNNNG